MVIVSSGSTNSSPSLSNNNATNALQSSILANLMWTGPAWDACVQVAESLFGKEERDDVMEWLRMIEDHGGSGSTASRRKVDNNNGQHPMLNGWYPVWLEPSCVTRNARSSAGKKSSKQASTKSRSKQHVQQKETREAKDEEDSSTLIALHEAGLYVPFENSPPIC